MIYNMPTVVPTLPDNCTDLTSEVFGDWSVLHYAGKYRGGYGQTMWIVRCKCGIKERRQGGALLGGYSQRCRDCSNKQRRHPERDNWLYILWKRTILKQIAVDHPWFNFNVFSSDTLPHPTDPQTVIAVNLNHPIGPGNWCWSTTRRRVPRVTVEINGIRQSTAVWARVLGLSRQRVSQIHHSPSGLKNYFDCHDITERVTYSFVKHQIEQLTK